MTNVEWFLKPTWTEDDQIEFWKKLKRCSERNRPHYLKAKASVLAESDDHSLLNTSIKLSFDFVEKYPDHKEIAVVYSNIATAYKNLGNVAEAINNFELALEKEQFTNYKTNAELDYAELAVNFKIVESFERAERYLLAKAAETVYLFPCQRYIQLGCLAVFANQRGDFEKAQMYANLAIDATKKTHSDAANHPKLGVLTESPVNTPLWSQLMKILEEN